MSSSDAAASADVTTAPLVAIAGPTGVGKTELSLELASALGGEIVNYDSVQIYRGFDVGSAKPSAEQRRSVPHHLFDIVEATEDYTAARFAREAGDVCNEIRSRSSVPILTGGTFFYLRALLHGMPEMPPKDEQLRARLDRLRARPRGAERLRRWLGRVDPVSASRISANDWHRTQRALEVHLLSGRPISSWERPSAATPLREPSLVFGLQIDRDTLRSRIDTRTHAMYATGLIEETRSLLSRYPAAARPFEAIGYREAVRHIRGEMSLENAIAETTRRTRAYAKRQMTWLRGEQNVEWVDASTSRARLVQEIRNRLEHWSER